MCYHQVNTFCCQLGQKPVNPLYILQHTKKHLFVDELSVKIKPVALAIIELYLFEGLSVSRKLKFCSNFLKSFWQSFILPNPIAIVIWLVFG